MGGALSRGKAAADPEVLADLRRLWHMLMHGCPSDHADQLFLPEAAFQHALTSGRNGVIVKRVFDMLDIARRGAVTCDEFACGLLPLASPRVPETERLRFLFRCYNLDGSGHITREDLMMHVLVSTLHSDLSLRVEEAEAVVAATFASVGCAGSQHLGWAEFKRLLRARPRLIERSLARLRIDVNLGMARLILASDTNRWLEIEPLSHAISPDTAPASPNPRTPVTDYTHLRRGDGDVDLSARETRDGSFAGDLPSRRSEPTLMSMWTSGTDYSDGAEREQQAYETPLHPRRYTSQWEDESPDRRSWAAWTVDSVAGLRKSYRNAQSRYEEDRHEQRTLRVLIP